MWEKVLAKLDRNLEWKTFRHSKSIFDVLAFFGLWSWIGPSVGVAIAVLASIPLWGKLFVGLVCTALVLFCILAWRLLTSDDSVTPQAVEQDIITPKRKSNLRKIGAPVIGAFIVGAAAFISHGPPRKPLNRSDTQTHTEKQTTTSNTGIVQGGGAVVSVGQQGGQTAGTIYNNPPPILPQVKLEPIDTGIKAASGRNGMFLVGFLSGGADVDRIEVEQDAFFAQKTQSRVVVYRLTETYGGVAPSDPSILRTNQALHVGVNLNFGAIQLFNDLRRSGYSGTAGVRLRISGKRLVDQEAFSFRNGYIAGGKDFDSLVLLRKATIKQPEWGDTLMPSELAEYMDSDDHWKDTIFAYGPDGRIKLIDKIPPLKHK